MLSLRPLSPLALVVLASSALPACLLDAGPYEGATGPAGGKGGTTGSTNTAQGGEGGSTSPGGSTTSGGTGGVVGGGGTGGLLGGGGTGGTVGGGGTGGEILVTGDKCPGKPDTISVYGNLLIAQNDTTDAKDDYGSGTCGGGQAHDLVHQITALGKGKLTVTLLPDPAFDGFLQVRTDCKDIASEVDCGMAVTLQVEKDQTVYVIVDGHQANPESPPSSGPYELQVYLDGCGNGTIEPSEEECDDSNDVAMDTCDQCKVRCTAEGSLTTHAITTIHPVTHHCYMLSYDPNTAWENAENDCVAWGGHLAALTSTQEIADILPFISATGEAIWIGGNDRELEDFFMWTTGEAWSYTDQVPPWDDPPFDPPEPNGQMAENCVELYKGGTLNDENCSAQQNWMCERSPAGAP